MIRVPHSFFLPHPASDEAALVLMDVSAHLTPSQIVGFLCPLKTTRLWLGSEPRLLVLPDTGHCTAASAPLHQNSGGTCGGYRLHKRRQGTEASNDWVISSEMTNYLIVLSKGEWGWGLSCEEGAQRWSVWRDAGSSPLSSFCRLGCRGWSLAAFLSLWHPPSLLLRSS